MKKLLTICLLLATTFTVKAQDMSFAQTVEYINKLLDEKTLFFWPDDSKGSSILVLDCEKNGIVTMGIGYGLTKPSLNLFDVAEWNIKENQALLLDKNKERVGKITGASTANFNRLKKALDYLRTLCTKIKDPFDN